MNPEDYQKEVSSLIEQDRREKAIKLGWYISYDGQSAEESLYELVSPDQQWNSEVCLDEEEAWRYLPQDFEDTERYGGEL